MPGIPDYLEPYFPKVGMSVGQWRTDVLIPFIMEREGHICWVEGCYQNADDVHEGIITRGDVQGLKLPYRVLAHSPVNCIALCKAHHKYAPEREVVYHWMCETYGKELVDWWFLTIPFKINPIGCLMRGKK